MKIKISSFKSNFALQRPISHVISDNQIPTYIKIVIKLLQQLRSIKGEIEIKYNENSDCSIGFGFYFIIEIPINLIDTIMITSYENYVTIDIRRRFNLKTHTIQESHLGIINRIYYEDPKFTKKFKTIIKNYQQIIEDHPF